MPTPIEAIEEFRRQCRKPQWTKGTHKTLKKVGKTALTVGVGIGATALGAAVPIIAAAIPLSLPAFVPLAGYGGIVSSIGEAGVDVMTAYDDAHDEDVARPPHFDAGILNRANIRSIADGKLLSSSEVAGNRAGTRGSIKIKDLLPAILSHYEASRKIMPVGQRQLDQMGGEFSSCHDAETIYKTLANLDYHLSKMKAYADALYQVAGAFKAFCDRNADNLEQAWDRTDGAMQQVMQKNPDWHRHNCPVMHTCYRTRKIGRMIS